MAGDSGSHFIVTFGRSGRVVERSGGSLDSEYYGSKPISGSKRSVKDRLGTSRNDSLDYRSHDKYKRQRGESNQASWRKNGSYGGGIGKGDLRYKILQKNVLRQSEDMDLRDKLSRKHRAALLPAHSTTSCPSQATSGARKDILDLRDSYNSRRQSIVEHGTYDGERKRTREPRDAYLRERQRGREFRDASIGERQSSLEVGDAYDHGRRGMLEPRGSYDHGKQCVLEPRESYEHGGQGLLGSFPSSRTASNLTGGDLVRNSYPSWTLDNLRQRSPDRILCSSTPRAFSPERNVEEMKKRAILRTYDDGKSTMYRRNDVPSPPRAVGTATVLTQPALHAVCPIPKKPAPLVTQYPQTSGLAQTISFLGQQPTVDGFLQSLGLEKYVIPFKAEEVDFNALRQMSDSDLKELGIPMGPRKKIIQALTARLR